MNIGRDQVIQLLRSQGRDDQAVQAGSELPGQVDTSNPDHTGMLSRYGIDPSDLEGSSAVSAELCDRSDSHQIPGVPSGSIPRQAIWPHEPGR